MNYVRLTTASMLSAIVALAGCQKADTQPATSSTSSTNYMPSHTAHGHGAGPNGGVVFDFGSHHAEFTVDHNKQQCTIVVLGDDARTPAQVGTTELLLNINKTKTAAGNAVAPMTITMKATDAQAGKAATFVGTDPGIGNVADFSGTVTGEIDGKPAMGEFDESAAGHGHSHAATPHDGVVTALKFDSGENAGFIELKLHDDKGDLEAWLWADGQLTEPLDIPADAVINVVFKDVPGNTATLSVRNHQQNEDEDGKPNLRNGMTNYFIFPGDSGQDPRWLMGKDFQSIVIVSFTVGNGRYTSDEFTLIPHTHADGHGHSH